MTTIEQFTGHNAYLSNFHVEADGLTLEHRFQAAKTLDPDEAARVLAASTPGQAKRLGRRVPLRADWDQAKEQVMLDLLRTKFLDPTLRARLDGTSDWHLSEGNYWNDTYWGVSLRTGRGKNRLGELLMQVRAENRAKSGIRCEGCDTYPSVVMVTVPDSDSAAAVSFACGPCALEAELEGNVISDPA